MSNLLPQRLAVVSIEFWLQEAATPAPRRIFTTATERRNEVVPPIGGRGLHLYGHTPSLWGCAGAKYC